MKKNSKFKKWLIHKLGGYTIEDMIKQPIKYSVQNIKLVPICAVHEISNIACFSEKHEDFIKHQLKMEMLEHIKPVYIVEKDHARTTYIYKAKIELPSNYVKECEE